jgi:hypothetical protein
MSRTPGMETPALHRTEIAFGRFNKTFHGSSSKTVVSAGNSFNVHPVDVNFRTLQFIRSAYLCPDWSRMAEQFLKELKRIETSWKGIV